MTGEPVKPHDTLILEAQTEKGEERPLLMLDSQKFPRSIGNKAILNFNPDTETDRLIDVNDNNTRLLSGDPDAYLWTPEQLEEHRGRFLQDVSRTVEGRLELSEVEKEKRRSILTGLFHNDAEYVGKSFIARFLPNKVNMDEESGRIKYVTFQVTPRKIGPYQTRSGEVVTDCFLVEFVNVTDLMRQIENLEERVNTLTRLVIGQIGDMEEAKIVQAGQSTKLLDIISGYIKDAKGALKKMGIDLESDEEEPEPTPEPDPGSANA